MRSPSGRGRLSPEPKEIVLDVPVVGPVRIQQRIHLPGIRIPVGLRHRHPGSPAVYAALATTAGVTMLLQAWLALAGNPGSAGTTLMIAPIFGVSVLAAILSARGRERLASLSVAGSLVVMTYLVAFGYRDPGVVVTLPIIGFVMALPYVRGRALVAFAGVVLLAIILIMGASAAARGGSGTAMVDVFFGGLVAALALLALTWRLVRSREQVVDRMTRFVEGVPVGIFRADAHWRLTEVNLAAARLLGYPGGESLLGATAADVLSEPMPEAGALAGATEEHGARTGEIELRRRDGSTVWVRYRVRTELDGEGRVAGFEGAIEDVTSDRTAREATERLLAWKKERADILDALHRLQPGLTIQQTADSICTEIGRGGELAYAAVLELRNGRGATVLAARSGSRPVTGSRVARAFAAELRRHAEDGPWVEDILSRRTEPGYRRLARAGLRQLALVPIEVGNEVVALLVAGTASEQLDLRDRLHTLGEFSTHAAALIGPALQARHRREELRDRIQDIIDRTAFRAVFQPIVDLASGAVLGYEALTRFDDGSPPDSMFADATACGMSVPLEIATIVAALEASAPLPASRFIDLNVSPQLVLAEEPLRGLLREQGFNIVLEITEHVAIEDYAALRAAFAALGDNVQVAVDDAGAGYASLRHITELRPQFVKLDRALISGIDGDLIRQALITGMAHFSDGVGSMLVAEGVETEAERATLLSLGVRAAQGYLFARPQSAELVPK